MDNIATDVLLLIFKLVTQTLVADLEMRSLCNLEFGCGCVNLVSHEHNRCVSFSQLRKLCLTYLLSECCGLL